MRRHEGLRKRRSIPRRSVHLVVLATLTSLAIQSIWAINPSRSITQYGHTSWLRKDGAFPGIPRQIVQTTDGYLWIGTTEGLVRFDGIRFVPWTPPSGEHLASSRINSLLAARDGSLWIGTTLGLSVWRNGHLTNIAGDAGVVPSIIEARDGSIWFVLYRPHGPVLPLCQVVGSGMHCLGPAHGVPEDNYTSLYEDDDGSFWLGGEKGLVHWSSRGARAFVPATAQRSEVSAVVNSIARSGNGSLWVSVEGTGKGRGLQRFTDGVWNEVQLPVPHNASLEIVRIYVDREKALWISTEDQGIFRIFGNKIDHFTHSDGLSGDLAIAFYEDRESNLWVTTAKGVDMFRNLPVISFSVNEGLKSGEIDGVYAAHDGSVWAGGMGAFYILNHGQVTSVDKAAGMPGDLATSFFQDSQGTMWIGVDKTLTVYHGGRFKVIHRRDGSPMGMVSGMAEDSEHNIWVRTIGSHASLVRIHDFVAQEDFPPPGTPAGRRVAADPRSGIWLGLTEGTIEHFTNGHADTYHFPHDSNTRIEQISVNPDGSVLAASPPGLIGLKDGRQLTMTTHNGLPCSTVYSFVSDNHGDLWLGMHCGIVRIPADDMQQWWNNSGTVVHTTIFDASDGAQPDVVPFQSGAVKSADGLLWFAASALLQMIDPDHLETNTLPPPVHIEQIVDDRQNYEPRDGLRLPPLPRHLEIDYSALSFVDPQKVRFRYMLEGKDGGWQDPGTRRLALYNDLGPGKYTFHVIACNNDGLWNETGAAFAFSITPAWYQTLVFQVVCAALAMLLLFAIYRIRVHQIATALSASFDERLAERTRLARELHDTFLQTVQGSKMVADDALDPGADETRMRQALAKLSRWLGQAVDEGRAALHSLRVSTVEKNHLSEALHRATEDHQLPASMIVAFSVIGDPRDVHPIVRDEIYRVGYEAIRNAAAHSRGSRLEIDIHYASDLLLRVRDNGLGIDPDLADKGREGHFGLQGMRERAARIHGKLSIVSSANTGTEVVLVVPGIVVYRHERLSYVERLKEFFKRIFKSSRVDGV